MDYYFTRSCEVAPNGDPRVGHMISCTLCLEVTQTHSRLYLYICLIRTSTSVVTTDACLRAIIARDAMAYISSRTPPSSAESHQISNNFKAYARHCHVQWCVAKLVLSVDLQRLPTYPKQKIQKFDVLQSAIRIRCTREVEPIFIDVSKGDLSRGQRYQTGYFVTSVDFLRVMEFKLAPNGNLVVSATLTPAASWTNEMRPAQTPRYGWGLPHHSTSSEKLLAYDSVYSEDNQLRVFKGQWPELEDIEERINPEHHSYFYENTVPVRKNAALDNWARVGWIMRDRRRRPLKEHPIEKERFPKLCICKIPILLEAEHFHLTLIQIQDPYPTLRMVGPLLSITESESLGSRYTISVLQQLGSPRARAGLPPCCGLYRGGEAQSVSGSRASNNAYAHTYRTYSFKPVYSIDTTTTTTTTTSEKKQQQANL
ncbi:unnamed protein product [Trichogramma brassicae]|uniref:Uncharacterized protein n=1 Tax=Trichogramma brassicae TaxID=86971 RepID=A0A6H5J4F8_9HYME|nr:unnamed protein product [Trichogramma brassicae]